MATRKNQASGGVVLIGVPEGACECGCGLEVARGSRFRQGHDQKLKSILGRAHKAGQPVAFVTGDARTESSAEQAFVARGWPVPAIPEPKAPRTKAAPATNANATAAKAHKRTTHKPARAIELVEVASS